jgi:hypothetical protein
VRIKRKVVRQNIWLSKWCVAKALRWRAKNRAAYNRYSN